MLYNPNYEKYTVKDGKFTTTHYIPKFKPNEREKVKKDIENKLFEIFKKYVIS